MAREVIILDGGDEGDGSRSALAAVVALLEQRGDRVAVVGANSYEHLAHCIGCFRCWHKTPGECVVRDDAREMVRRVVASDLLVFFTPVTFGGYSAALKNMVDRLVLPLIQPFFTTIEGETHHPIRYEKGLPILAVGVQQRPDATEADVFRLLVGRNAVNLHAPSHSSVILPAGELDHEGRRSLTAALVRQDPRPFRADVDALMPRPHELTGVGSAPRRALLIVGSPRIGSSTSSVVGSHVLARLAERGVATSQIVLKSALRTGSQRTALLDEVQRADLVVLTFPLYADTLPTLPTLALETLSARREAWSGDKESGKRLFAICNSGFPEGHHNTVALAICERFAAFAGMHWSGGLKFGGGAAIVDGAALTGPERQGHLPARNLIRSLDLAADALARGENVPDEANDLLARSPIPYVPFALWRWAYGKIGTMQWKRLATENGVKPATLRARPHLKRAEG